MAEFAAAVARRADHAPALVRRREHRRCRDRAGHRRDRRGVHPPGGPRPRALRVRRARRDEPQAAPIVGRLSAPPVDRRGVRDVARNVAPYLPWRSGAAGPRRRRGRRRASARSARARRDLVRRLQQRERRAVGTGACRADRTGARRGNRRASSGGPRSSAGRCRAPARRASRCRGGRRPRTRRAGAGCRGACSAQGQGGQRSRHCRSW